MRPIRTPFAASPVPTMLSSKLRLCLVSVSGPYSAMSAGLAAKDFTFTSPLMPCAPRMAPISTSRCDVAEEDMA